MSDFHAGHTVTENWTYIYIYIYIYMSRNNTLFAVELLVHWVSLVVVVE